MQTHTRPETIFEAECFASLQHDGQVGQAPTHEVEKQSHASGLVSVAGMCLVRRIRDCVVLTEQRTEGADSFCLVASQDSRGCKG